MEQPQKQLAEQPEKPKELSEDHWFRITERLHEKQGEVPDPLQIRAAAMLDALGLPVGEFSALETDAEGKRTNPEKDRIIAEYLTNKPGVMIDEEQQIVSADFRDIYPDGLPEELKEALDPDTLAIMEEEYKHREWIRETFGDTENPSEADAPLQYQRLPGGVDLFLRGYRHTPSWQKNHGPFLEKANVRAAVIGIEGYDEAHLGDSLNIYWENYILQDGAYTDLMHEAAKAGFKGYFTEVDARDRSKINMDSQKHLPPVDVTKAFLKHYFSYLEREHPQLAAHLESVEGLEKAWRAQTTDDEGLLSSEVYTYRNNVQYHRFSYYSKDNSSPKMAFFELGQHMFTDALAAIKLHLIGKLMTEGKIEKGPIIDYEGFAHLSNKQFFLRYPQYAMEVVLRTIHELMAGKVKKRDNLPEIYEVFDNPDWTETFKEIVRIPLAKAEDAPEKSVEIGPNQRKLLDKTADVLSLLGIDPKQVIPSDNEIARIRERVASHVAK